MVCRAPADIRQAEPVLDRADLFVGLLKMPTNGAPGDIDKHLAERVSVFQAFHDLGQADRADHDGRVRLREPHLEALLSIMGVHWTRFYLHRGSPSSGSRAFTARDNRRSKEGCPDRLLSSADR